MSGTLKFKKIEVVFPHEAQAFCLRLDVFVFCSGVFAKNVFSSVKILVVYLRESLK